MSSQKRAPLVLRRNRKVNPKIQVARPVKVSESAPERPTRETKSADKLVAACRENVQFLNFHLQPYAEYLELPMLVDNALYLAYTIRVRENSPLDSLSLRKRLAEAGIETDPSFSFTASSADCSSVETDNRIRGYSAQSDLDSDAFCLGCHQYLTILDLEHIVDTFESIFSCPEGDPSTSNPSDNRENRI
jgi:dTDP-4-amino-4,6-dideoxygalactose transaminase